MSDDTISRQDLLSKINRIDRLPMLVEGKLMYVVPRENVNKIIKNMPSAQKKGEWIEVEVIADAYDISGVKTWASKMRCDQCGFTTIAIEGCFSQYNFCPNCGADMRGEEYECKNNR